MANEPITGDLLRERLLIDIDEESRLHEVLLPQRDLTEPPTEWAAKDANETAVLLRQWVLTGLVALYWDHNDGYPLLTDDEARAALADPGQWAIENAAVATARLVFTEDGDATISPRGPVERPWLNQRD